MLGYGLGLRSPHYEEVLTNQPKVDWFEVISENFMNVGGQPRRILHSIRENYPVILHGVSMSLGAIEPLNKEYMKQLKILADEIQPQWMSDHLCWGSHGPHYAHDLLPLPYTEETLKHLTTRIQYVQDYLKRPFLVENVSSYLTYKESEMPEWYFLNELVTRSGCKLLLDINNIYVSSCNHDFNASEFLNALPKDCVGQFHLAGHLDLGKYVNDTHDHDVCDDVWDLYQIACERFAPVATMIERDDNIPEFIELLGEMNKSKEIQEKIRNEKNREFSRNSKRVLEVPIQL
ncbi:MAG: DUF692 domain-containing protein [Oligoflexia bacterium]|nr:DUF692 domain-containing protein [Oligoflexia bacterium]